MIPVVGVPTVGESQLQAMVDSIDYPVGDLVIVDNSRHGVDVTVPDCVDRVWRLHMPSNMGVGPSWNLIIKSTPHAAWWLIVNSDVKCQPGALERIAGQVEGVDLLLRPRPFAPFGAFAITERCVAAHGLFDEYYHPIYYEDTDYMQRVGRAGGTVTFELRGIPDVSAGGSLAFRQPTVERPSHQRLNETANANRLFFQEQWADGDPKPKRGWDLTRRRELDVDWCRP